MCRVLGVPRNTYCQYFKKVKSTYNIENEMILERMRVIHMESKECYGASKIHYLLGEEGFVVSLNCVQRIMKKVGIRSVITKEYRPPQSAGLFVEKLIYSFKILQRLISTKSGLRILLISIHGITLGAIWHPF